MAQSLAAAAACYSAANRPTLGLGFGVKGFRVQGFRAYRFRVSRFRVRGLGV